MTLLTREQSISNPPLLKTEKIPVPEFGDGVELAVRGLTARQRWSFGQMAAKASEDETSGPEPTSYLISLAAIDDNGKALYQVQDCDFIAEWPGDLVDRVGDVIMQMSGLTKKATEDAGKDSGPSPTESGPTESLETSPAPSTN